MMQTHNRRGFLQASLATGTGLTLASGGSSHEEAPDRAPSAEAANPSIRPGRVRWHADFGAACAASARSGKPVLLFQMLGRMDQKFC